MAVKREFFRAQPEVLRALVAELANDHVQQNHAIFFAQNSVRLARDHLITMATKKLHGELVKQVEDQQPIVS